MIASLPMYDWPEVHGATDALWTALRDAIRDRGMAAPEALDRTAPTRAVWTNPAMILSQTCSMPYRQGLHRAVAIIGTPDYGIEGCPPGYYRSVIVVRADDPREDIAAYTDGTCAFNAPDSQSGRAVWGETAFASWLETGAHRGSIHAVAEGRADIAAIDAVSWRLAQRHQPKTARLRVLSLTPPTPGLPFITAKGKDTDQLADAATDAIVRLDSETRAALGLSGFVQLPASVYAA